MIPISLDFIFNLSGTVLSRSETPRKGERRSSAAQIVVELTEPVATAGAEIEFFLKLWGMWERNHLLAITSRSTLRYRDDGTQGVAA
ncbi:MAG: hypothetical protein P1V20_19735 [Verrucomicrobiales bacterium]|nr:hypothetical protein [Verrucomicrobiales bacterium]